MRTLVNIFLTSLAIWIVLLSALVLASCGSRNKPVELIEISKSCFENVGPRPRPRPEAALLDGPGEDGCPEKFEFCAEPTPGQAIEQYIRAAALWMSEVEAVCKPMEKEK